MAELKLFDIAGSFNQGYDRGQQLRKTSRLAELASQAYAAPTQQRDALVQLAVANDPSSGFQLSQSLRADEDARNKSLVNMARMLVNAPEGQRQAIYSGMVPQLQRMGLQQLPLQYDESVAQTAQALVQAYGGIGGSGVQSTYVDGQGNRVAIMRDGSTQVLGQNDAGMSQQTLNVDINGVPTQVTFDKRTGRYTTASLGGGQPAAPVQAPAGVYIDPSLPPQVQQAIAAAEASGQQVPSQMYFGGGGQPGGALVGRTKEAEAAAVEAAKQGVQLSYLPTQQAIETQGAVNRASQLAPIETAAAISRTRGTEMAKAEADALASLPQTIQAADETIALLTQALNHPGRTVATGLSGTLDPRNYAPGTDARDFRVLLDQIGGRAFLQAFESLKGGGQITEIEGRKATEAMARLNTAQSDEAFEAALKELIGIAQKAKTNALRRASSAGSGMYGPAPADAPPSNAIPAPGHTEGGYRFRGGNPADPSNWERV